MTTYDYEVPMEVLNASAVLHNYANLLESPSRPQDYTLQEIIEAIRTINSYDGNGLRNPQDVRCEHGSRFASAGWLKHLEFTTPCGCMARIVEKSTPTNISKKGNE